VRRDLPVCGTCGGVNESSDARDRREGEGLASANLAHARRVTPRIEKTRAWPGSSPGTVTDRVVRSARSRGVASHCFASSPEGCAQHR
jgi:hypothetical protein